MKTDDVTPAKAGVQSEKLDSRFCGNDKYYFRNRNYLRENQLYHRHFIFYKRTLQLQASVVFNMDFYDITLILPAFAEKANKEKGNRPKAIFLVWLISLATRGGLPR